jgi:hypothetical protein
VSEQKERGKRPKRLQADFCTQPSEIRRCEFRARPTRAFLHHGAAPLQGQDHACHLRHIRCSKWNVLPLNMRLSQCFSRVSIFQIGEWALSRAVGRRLRSWGLPKHPAEPTRVFCPWGERDGVIKFPIREQKPILRPPDGTCRSSCAQVLTPR